MIKAKITLSAKEMQLANNASVILTKNSIIHKTKMLLEVLQDEMLKCLDEKKEFFPKEIMQFTPKISKGENYKGLPYLILDYPRHFNKENIFAIRTLFWWGNFFSCTLHISGKYKNAYREKIISSYPLLKKEKYFICIDKNEWEHHFEQGNFTPLNKISSSLFEKTIKTNSFIKLSKKIPVTEWKKATSILFTCFQFYIEMLSDQLPRR